MQRLTEIAVSERRSSRRNSDSMPASSQQDFEAVERLLERWHDLPAAQRSDLVQKLTSCWP
jgi:hypothetical protein